MQPAQAMYVLLPAVLAIRMTHIDWTSCRRLARCCRRPAVPAAAGRALKVTPTVPIASSKPIDLYYRPSSSSGAAQQPLAPRMLGFRLPTPACTRVAAPLQHLSSAARAPALPRASRLPPQGAAAARSPPARRPVMLCGPRIVQAAEPHTAPYYTSLPSSTPSCSLQPLSFCTHHAQASPGQQHGPLAALRRPAARRIGGGSLGPSTVASQGATQSLLRLQFWDRGADPLLTAAPPKPR